jgi:hypothetical protein
VQPDQNTDIPQTVNESKLTLLLYLDSNIRICKACLEFQRPYLLEQLYQCYSFAEQLKSMFVSASGMHGLEPISQRTENIFLWAEIIFLWRVAL